MAEVLVKHFTHFKEKFLDTRIKAKDVNNNPFQLVEIYCASFQDSYNSVELIVLSHGC